MKKLDQKGSHVLVVLLVIVVVAAVAGVGYYVFKKQKSSSSSTTSKAAQEAAQKCEEEDKNICKFFASWKDSKYYTVDTTSTAAGKTSNMKMEYVAPDRYHIVMSGELAYETISIGTTTYTKTDGVWYKQTQKKEDVDKYKSESNTNFEEPAKDTAPEKKTTYKLIGTEACGNLTCFKYQVINPDAKDTTEYMWFDNKDYQLRKTSTESNGEKSESTFSYTKLEIKEPSPVKELGPNQVVIPGQGVVDMPSAADVPQ